MQKAGIHADYIGTTLAEVVALGLVTITHRGSYSGGARKDPSTYRLNYLPWKFVPAVGPPVYYAPLDEWKNYRKPASRKSIRMPLTDGATNYQSCDAFEGAHKDDSTSLSAGVIEAANATDGWKRSSKRGSTGALRASPDPSSEARWAHVARRSRVKTKNASAGSVLAGAGPPNNLSSSPKSPSKRTSSG